MSQSPRPRLWTFDFALTLLGTIGFFSSFFYLLAVLPDYIDEIGGAKWQIGLIVGGFNVVPLVLRPFAGRWSDRGRRKRVLRVGLLTMVASLLLMTLSHDIASLFLLRLVQGVGMATCPTASASMIAELSPLPRRGEGVGMFGMATGVAQMFPPAIGVAVAAAWGFDAVFIIAAVTAGLTLLVVEPVREPTSSSAGVEGGATLFPRPALFPMSVFMTVTFSFAATSTFLPLLGEERGLGNVGLFFLLVGVASTLVRPVAGAASDRVGRVPVALPGLVATVASMWFLAVAYNPLMLIVAGFMAGAGLAGAHTALLALAIDRVADTARGRATAVLQLAWDISGLAGGVVLGIVASWFDVPMVYWASGGLAVVGMVWLLIGRATGQTRPYRRPVVVAQASHAGFAQMDEPW